MLFLFLRPPHSVKAQKRRDETLIELLKQRGWRMKAKLENAMYSFYFYCKIVCNCCSDQRGTDFYIRLKLHIYFPSLQQHSYFKIYHLGIIFCSFKWNMSTCGGIDSHTVERTKLRLYTKYCTDGKSVSKWDRTIRSGAQKYLSKTNLWHSSVIVSLTEAIKYVSLFSCSYWNDSQMLDYCMNSFIITNKDLYIEPWRGQNEVFTL